MELAKLAKFLKKLYKEIFMKRRTIKTKRNYLIPIDYTITNNQINSLEKIIWNAPKISELAKKFIIWLIRKSEMLSRQVIVLFSPGSSHLVSMKEIIHGVHDINSINNSELNEILTAMGSSMKVFSSMSLRAKPMAGISFDGNAFRIFYDDIEKEVEEIEKPEISIMLIPKIGQQIIFKSFFNSTSRRNGEIATVVVHGNNPEYPDGVTIGVEFEKDGHAMVIRTDECLPYK